MRHKYFKHLDVFLVVLYSVTYCFFFFNLCSDWFIVSLILRDGDSLCLGVMWWLLTTNSHPSAGCSGIFQETIQMQLKFRSLKGSGDT